MTVFGYARVSTDGQTLDSQVEALKAAGCGKIFREKVSGARADRPQLLRLLAAIGSGDVLIVSRLDRLARSTRDLLNRLHRQSGARLVGRSASCARRRCRRRLQSRLLRHARRSPCRLDRRRPRDTRRHDQDASHIDRRVRDRLTPRSAGRELAAPAGRTSRSRPARNRRKPFF
jgi:hypothetical protein